ncbi:EpsG family protein [Pediococcus pentosaceus]|uniref:EpsG family protein n=1 Tax=Pediococcus pentosaceus TaxID=1255 RepID=UPI0018A149B2|nr:EpsG family protein [Pediococcus pentosaceus]MBF7140306.1 EpsG family protein [Pediococcus pentosaceus]MCM6819407.1 EpsG family protein [Pediococcus pentosaceus]
MIYVYMMFLATMLVGGSEYVKRIKIKENDGYLTARSQIIYRKILANFLYILSFFVIFIPGAIRYYVGIDYTTYSLHQIPEVLSNTPNTLEFLYKVVIKFGYWIGGQNSYQMIFFLTDLIIVVFLFLYIAESSTQRWLSIIIFMSLGFFFFSLSGMRQSIGVIIALWGLKFIKEKNILKYVITILIAALFHSSVIIFLLFYFIDKIKVNPFFVSLIMIVLNVTAVYIRQFIIFVSDQLDAYSNYFGGQFDNGEYGKSWVFLVLVVMLLLCVSRVALGKTLFYKNNMEINIHYFACLVVSIIGYLPTPVRLLFLFMPVYITLIPNVISLYRNKYTRIMLYGITIIVSAIFMYWFLFIQNIYMVLPYRYNFGNLLS